MLMSDFNSATLAKKSATQMSTVVEGETVVLEMESGGYFSLDEIGALVWNALNEVRSVADICARIVAQYEVEPEQCETDVIRLLNELRAAKLIEIV